MNLAKDLLSVMEDIDPVMDIINIQKVIQKELSRLKVGKLKKVELPQKKEVIFNQSSGGGSVVISSPNVKVELGDSSWLIGTLKIYLVFREDKVTVSYNFLPEKSND